MNIDTNSLLKSYEQYQKEFDDAALSVLHSGWYVLGKYLKSFEEEFAAFCNCKYCSGVASGLDALWITCKLLGIGNDDEVIVPANTYIATIMGITRNGAKPVFVEPDEYYGIDAKKIENVITKKTKAIMCVHLYGNPCEMNTILEIVKKHNILLIEDCAQSHGAYYCGKVTGTFGNAGCYSFYPTKNLGAFGDGGAVITNDLELDQKIRVFRNYGSQKKYYNTIVGTNSRLDEIQAALLLVKLRHFNQMIIERQKIAARYNIGIQNNKLVLPKVRPNAIHVYHQYVIRTEEKEERSRLIQWMLDRGIKTMIHYPIPPHLSEAYSYLGYYKGSFPITEHYADTVLSIPIYNGYTEDEQSYVIKALNDF